MGIVRCVAHLYQLSLSSKQKTKSIIGSAVAFMRLGKQATGMQVPIMGSMMGSFDAMFL